MPDSCCGGRVRDNLSYPRQIKEGSDYMSKIVSMDTALDLIRDGAVVGTSGFMIAGTPESVFRAMGERYAQTGHPGT